MGTVGSLLKGILIELDVQVSSGRVLSLLTGTPVAMGRVGSLLMEIVGSLLIPIELDMRVSRGRVLSLLMGTAVAVGRVGSLPILIELGARISWGKVLSLLTGIPVAVGRVGTVLSLLRGIPKELGTRLLMGSVGSLLKCRLDVPVAKEAVVSLLM